MIRVAASEGRVAGIEGAIRRDAVAGGEPVKALLRRAVPLLPIVLLLGLTGAGLAGALQEDDAGPDLGPQPADYGGDVAGYLVGSSEYQASPAVPAAEEIEYRAFGCAEGAPITISVVPRLLQGADAEANDALADDDPAKLAQEPVVVVEEAAALAEGSSYAVTIPESIPEGFARIRVDCSDADGNPLTSDTVIDLVSRAAFEAAQAELGDDEEPEELVLAIDGKAAAEPVEPAAGAAQGGGEDDGAAAEEDALAETGAETSLLLVIAGTVVAFGALLAVYGRRFRQL